MITENFSKIIYHQSPPEGQFEYGSPAALEIIGHTPNEFYQKSRFIEDIVHLLYRDQLNGTKNKLIEGNFLQDPANPVLRGI